MDVVTDRPVLSAPYTALARATGIIGIVFMVLLFGPIIALSTAGEPPLDATASEAVKYFGNIEANWAQLALAASTLGWIGSLWFFVAFGYLLRRAEGDPPWRSTIATLSGALLAAYGLVGVSVGGGLAARGQDHPRRRRFRVGVRQCRLRERMDRGCELRTLIRLGNPLHTSTRALDGLVAHRGRPRPGGCQIRFDERPVDRAVPAVLGLGSGAQHPADPSAQPARSRGVLTASAAIPAHATSPMAQASLPHARAGCSHIA